MALVDETLCMYCRQANVREYEEEKESGEDYNSLKDIILKKLNDIVAIIPPKNIYGIEKINNEKFLECVHAQEGASEQLLKEYRKGEIVCEFSNVGLFHPIYNDLYVYPIVAHYHDGDSNVHTFKYITSPVSCEIEKYREEKKDSSLYTFFYESQVKMSHAFYLRKIYV